MADGDLVNITFKASEGGHSFTAEASLDNYDPGNLIAIDQAIRHMAVVVDHLEKKANEMLGLIEKPEDFRIIKSTGGKSRARVYVAPANNGGIHLELADSVLLKAAMGMEGK